MFPQLAAVLTAPGLQNYFLQCVAPVPAPQLTPFSAWALRHEYHLQYLVLSLAQKAVGSCLQSQPHPAVLPTSPLPFLLKHAAPTPVHTPWLLPSVSLSLSSLSSALFPPCTDTVFLP